MGVRGSEGALTGIKVTSVLRASAAEAAGLAAGDEILALDGWRIRKLDDAQRLLSASGAASLLVVRDQRVFNLSLTLGTLADAGTVVLEAAQSNSADKSTKAARVLRQAWLGR